ncbi:hypothetical protein CQ007_09375 [Pseudomonas sp. MYb185]|nr:hypothetical protein CQ007_09375 [Pseudomonas sp. MYb185]
MAISRRLFHSAIEEGGMGMHLILLASMKDQGKSVIEAREAMLPFLENGLLALEQRFGPQAAINEAKLAVFDLNNASDEVGMLSINSMQQTKYYHKLRDEKAKNSSVPTSNAAVSIMLFLLRTARTLGNKVWVDLDLVTEQAGVSFGQINIECMSLEESGLVEFDVMEGVRVTDEGLYIARKLKDWLEWSEKDNHETASHGKGRDDENKTLQKPMFSLWNVVLYLFMASAILKMVAHFVRG